MTTYEREFLAQCEAILGVCVARGIPHAPRTDPPTAAQAMAWAARAPGAAGGQKSPTVSPGRQHETPEATEYAYA